MTYQKTIKELFELRRFGIKPGLANIKNLLNLLGNPQKNINIIHIAGTNGKGSTAAFLQSILKYSGYQTGLYTSPHLIDFCERIKIILYAEWHRIRPVLSPDPSCAWEAGGLYRRVRNSTSALGSGTDMENASVGAFALSRDPNCRSVKF